MSRSSVDIRPAAAADRVAVKELLGSAGLPLDGLGDAACSLWVARAGGEVVGVAGLERYGEAGLLRSVAVREGWRGRGVAEALCRHVFAEAAASGVSRLSLLTETAADYFRRLGFVSRPRAEADPALSASAELAGGRCASAALMVRSLP